MSYRSYNAVDFNDLDCSRLANDVEGEWTVVAQDAAKQWQYAIVYTVDREATDPEQLLDKQTLFRWRHPTETSQVFEMLTSWATETLEVVVEPSGSYPAGWIEMLQAAEEVELAKMKGKKTRDSKENYDNVPSLHDAKAADVIARLHLSGASTEWWKRNRRQRQLKATAKHLDRLKGERNRERNRLEGALGAYWPELLEALPLSSRTLLELVDEFGAPDSLVDDPERARALIDRVSRGQISASRQQAIVEAAEESVGKKPIPEEIAYMQSIARRLLELRKAIRDAERHLDELQDDYQPARRIRAFAGPLVGGVVVGEVGDPRDFSAAAAYEKAAGLNLVEDTTGTQGQHTDQDDAPSVRISKRGSSRARKHLFIAVQRWIQDCEVARAWYRRKIQQHAGCQAPEVVASVALMRKMIRLLYHIGRGAEYDPTKLFDIRQLDLDRRQLETDTTQAVA